MGVVGLWRLLCLIFKNVLTKDATAESGKTASNTLVVAAVVLGLVVPFQMVSQTWDDHDRSGRYAARDFGMNYLSSVDENGIIFTNGDNDTFPLWYVQEVEGWRTDVRVVNLSYLSTDWYINQMRRPAYESAALPMQAPRDAFAYDRRQFNYFISPDTAMVVPAQSALKALYSDDYNKNAWGLPEFKYPQMFIPVNADDAVKNGIVAEKDRDMISEYIRLNMLADRYTMSDGGMSSSKVMSIDIISSVINEGWKRPIYFAMTVPESYYDGLMPYMSSTGMAYELTPIEYGYDGTFAVNTDKAYRNVTEKFRWGGLDVKLPEDAPYLDETVRRMVTTTRSAMVDLASALVLEGLQAKSQLTDTIGGALPLAKGTPEYAETEKYMNDRFAKAHHILDLIEQKLPAFASPYAVQIGQQIAQISYLLGSEAGMKDDIERAKRIIESELLRWGQYVRYYQSLNPRQYSLLTNTDMYVDTYYLMELLQLHNTIMPEETEAVMKRLQAEGVNLERVFARYPKANEQ